MNFSEYRETHQADICVIGGGLAGLFAAVSAARGGAKVLLMHDRPVLGGNASSEVRMWVRGAAGFENRETGLIQEVELENIYRNPTMNYSLWDTVLYQLAAQEKNLTLLLNTSCLGCDMEDGKIARITGWQLNSYTFHTVEADLFIDCSGDSILAPLTGAKYRVGREARSEFDEYAALETADRHTMGSSCLIEARKTDHACPFTPPSWAYTYPDDESMYLKNHDIAGTGVNFWWIELGGMEDTIRDAQKINEELLRVAYGVWDHLKNQGDHGMDNWELEWVGFLPGKRESRRYEGPYLLNQRDLEEGHHFPDAVAFGGWTMDNHNPLGFKYMGYSSEHITPVVPYEIPFRSLYSVNVPNLMCAGRNISATHMALSSTRVMATCSLIGQAAGTGAAVAMKHGCLPADVTAHYMEEVQTRLMEDGCYIPGLLRKPTGKAKVRVSPEEEAILLNGWERPHTEKKSGKANLSMTAGDDVFLVEDDTAVTAANSIVMPQELVIDFTEPASALRLALDPDFSRQSISDDPRYQKFAMRTHIDWPEKKVSMPANMLRDCIIAAIGAEGGETLIPVKNNHRTVLTVALPENTVRVIIREVTSWGGGETRLFSADAAR